VNHQVDQKLKDVAYLASGFKTLRKSYSAASKICIPYELERTNGLGTASVSLNRISYLALVPT